MRKFNTRWWKMAATVLAVAAISSLGVSAANADSTSVADDHAPIDSLVGGDGPPDIVVSEPDHSLAVRDHDVAIELPGQLTSDSVDIDVVPEGLFYGEPDPLLSTRVGGSLISSFATDAGVQTLISISGPSASHEYRFPLGLPEGGSAQLLEDGAVSLRDRNGVLLGFVRAPWAIDAGGATVPTSFRVENGDLVQTVAFGPKNSFPVVADPDLGVEWWGYYVQLTRSETKKVAQTIANHQGPSVLAGVICGALPAPPAVAACGLTIAYAYFRIIDPLNRANSAGKCAAINYPWLSVTNPNAGFALVSVTTVRCRR